MNQYMPGAGSPAQTMQQQQPLIQALRQPQPMPQPSGPQLMPVQSGMDPRVTNMIGTGQYGTSPFSEQTRGLQAADAGLR